MTSHRQAAHRHLMIVHNHWPDPRVEREARALVAGGIEVDVLCARDPYDSPDSDFAGIDVQRLPVWRRRGRGPVLQMLEYLAFLALAAVHAAVRHGRRRYRTIQVHTPPDFLVFAALVPKLTGAKVILDLHDLMPEFYASRFGSSLSALPVRLVAWQERLSTRFADRVITVTDTWRRTLAQRGVARDKLSVLMNLPDPAIYGRDGAEAARPDGPITLVYHGTLAARYGLDIALRALARARQEIPIRMIIHGHGDLLETLPDLAEELGIADAVEFSTRRLASEELPALLRRADAAVVPYRRDIFTDGILPTKLMEYAALGIPAIASRTPVIEEYFDESMVRFVPPEDVEALAAAMVELARDPELRADLARSATQFTERHSWPAASADYVAMVRSLADG
ncbi:MAG TPA: glycosyltransferase family 4 protein [Candidatus Limnocylindria bacterium]|nr:glycosyltransferase family 4 protein [Candidatus Limnocylindria bacterium]